MKTQDFNAYKTRYRNAIRKVLSQAEPGRLDEAGFPAYSHPNPFINWLFWQRLRKVMDYIETSASYENILDFGCGSGVMLPYLSQVSRQVTAVDIDLLPLERIQKHIPTASNVQVFDLNKTNLASLPQNSFEVIIATDVLEHVADLPRTFEELFKLLKPNGRVVVSGPTENILYQIGRKLAGPEYSGAYHERGIGEIKKEIERFAHIERIATLYWYLPLFEVFAVKKEK
jgi:2-polyprenyl-3-methyl-5-hydroxy-6-metoxy-1,4-benzoquinol methylase